MIDPAVLRALQAAGATTDMIIAAVEADNARAEEKREAKRANNRERQRRFREAHNADNALHDVTARDERDRVSLDKEAPQTPKEINPIPCVRETRARPGEYHRLPEGWKPTRPLPPNIQAKADQWPPGALDEELAALHRWALNAENKPGKGRKKDWDTAWHNWIDRKHNDHRNRQPSAQQGPPKRGSPALELYKRGALREAEEARLGEDGAADWGAGASLPSFGPS